MPDKPTTRSQSRLVICRGARAAEERLLADLRLAHQSGIENPALLARPILVVVPSAGLRRQLAARITSALGGVALGVTIQTLRRTAHLIVEAAGGITGKNPELFHVLLRREAAREEILRESLAQFEDGYAVTAEAVKDLLDAGFAEKDLPALRKELSRTPAGAIRNRAEAILKVAVAISKEMKHAGISLDQELLTEAARIIESDQREKVLPARNIFVYGFSDATGRAMGLLQALLRHYEGIAYLDESPDPISPDQPDQGAVFIRRFANRLSSVTIEERHEKSTPPANLSAFHASGTSDEIREISYRILELLHAGTPPEEIAVAGNIPRYGMAIQRHFEELGIPYSVDVGGSEAIPASLSPMNRRWRAALSVMRERERAPADLWLDALPGFVKSREDLRLAIRATGAAFLGEVAALETKSFGEESPEKGYCRLPVRKGFVDLPAEDGRPASTVAARRTLSLDLVEGLLSLARNTREILQRWPQRAPVVSHLSHCTKLLKEVFSWDDGLLKAALPETDSALEISREEFLLLFERYGAGIGAPSIGGTGAGVQVLTLTLARGLTFPHLFLIGLNRGELPHPPAEDPLLPDELRLALARMIPDIPVKRRRIHEEHLLFAHLLSAARNVTLSWQRSNDDGKALSISPLVERLVIEERLTGEPTAVPRQREMVLKSPFAGGPTRPRTARDSLQLAALAGSRMQVAEILPLALEESRTVLFEEAAAGYPGTEALSAARIEVLDEMAPDLSTPAGRKRLSMPSPYLGFVAPLESGKPDPRAGTLYITTLERLAACPWQTLLSRLLHLEPAPDPLLDLPDIDPALLGSVVHLALERIVKEKTQDLPGTFAGALAAGGAEVARPDAKRVQVEVARAAAEAAAGAGLRLPGLRNTLATRALPYVERAISLEWPENTTSVKFLGTEFEITTTIRDSTGIERPIAFRADAVTMKDGRLVLTDYKTGRKPVSEAKTEKTRQAHLAAQLASGERLQIAAYASVPGDVPATGRYLFLNPDLPDYAALASLDTGEDLVQRVFTNLSGQLFAAWEQGAFFPRLETPKGKEPDACANCEVAEACLREDSAVRRRIRELAQSLREDSERGAHLAPQLSSLKSLWWLGQDAPAESSPEEAPMAGEPVKEPAAPKKKSGKKKA